MALIEVVGREVPEVESDPDTRIISYVMPRVKEWEEYRQNNFDDKWDEYYRLWRGIWKDSDSTRKSERSKLISPALSQAVEASSAEIEEAIFGRGRFFDLSDDVLDEQKEDMLLFRNLLWEDFEDANVPSGFRETILNGCLYGTGIAKILVEEKMDYSVSSQEIMDTGVAEFAAEPSTRPIVTLTPIHPKEFAIDPLARTVEEAHGCAHIFHSPLHVVTQRQVDGIYKNVPVGISEDPMDLNQGVEDPVHKGDSVKLVEYYGLVPESYLDPELGEDEELVEFELEGDTFEGTNLVEAIVTIANDSVVLRAVRNPFTMQDRPIIAYQHDTVPNSFWGRGIAEKGYNPQKALDAELRGRIDAMAMAIHPMMAVDATRMVRGADFSVRPGRTIPINGDPRTALMPFNMQNVGAQTFSQSGELERMIQMGTGAMDSATPVGISPRNSTASGMSMIMGGVIKRSKRTLANIERTFTAPFVKKAAWRYMQFAPDRYPVKDPKFSVHSTLGIMAREMEVQQLVNLLQTVPPDSPAFWLLIQNIYEYSNLTNKEQMLQFVNMFLQQSMQPKQPEPPSMKDQIALERLKLDAAEGQVRLQIEASRAETERMRVQIEAARTPAAIDKVKAETVNTLAKAEAEDAKVDLGKYDALVKTITAQSGVNRDAGREGEV